MSENKCYTRNMNNTFNLLTVRSTNGCYLNGTITILYFFHIIVYNINCDSHNKTTY